MPGEVPSPTQPFPTKPEPFDYQGVEIDDLVDFTPEIRAMAVEAVRPFRIGPLFTPPGRPIEGGTQGTLMRPYDAGAAGWAGPRSIPRPAFSTCRHATSRSSSRSTRRTRRSAPRSPTRTERPRTSGWRGAGRPGPRMPQGLPLLQAAVFTDDGHRHEHRRARVDGAAWRRRPVPEPSAATRPGPAAARRRRVGRAGADEDAADQYAVGGRERRRPATGRARQADRAELGSVDLPTGALGTPMTYMVDGRQYIALTVGGRPPELIAFALP